MPEGPRIVVFWDGRHCELRASIADDGSIEVYPVFTPAPLPSKAAFYAALTRLGFQGPSGTAGEQIRAWMYQIWTERGKVDAQSVNALRELRSENGEALKLADIIDAITLADK
jgi:hypothetical protein